MALELHVWGPAFTLPSVDAQCLAAIAYLSLTLPQDKWVLVASSDAGWSPTKELPVLKDDDVVISGLQNIIDYLRQKSNGEWDLDREFNSPGSRADITAFTSHILTTLSPLLSLSLYVSTENYTTTTRPTYTHILPWPTQYYIPPSHLRAAETQTSHLNLSPLDLSTLNEDDSQRHKRRLADVIPERLRSTTTKTVTSLVRESRTGTRFKCDALLDAACAPLQQLLADKKYLLAPTPTSSSSTHTEEKPSSLDCLALAYLSLALIPSLPQPWLREGILTRYPILSAYAEKGVQQCFGGAVSIEDAGLNGHKNERSNEKLQWKPPAQWGIRAASSTILHDITSSLPFSQPSIVSTTAKSQHETSSGSTAMPAFLPTMMAAGTAVAATAGYLLYSSLGAEPSDKRNLRDMGEAGALFAGLQIGDKQRKESVAERLGTVPMEDAS